MSVFALKLIAVLSMVTDHTAYMLFQAQRIGYPVMTALRSIGRLAFPIYCFLLVNGLRKTSDRAAYFMRLCVFALISQLPFSLLSASGNYPPNGLDGLRLAGGCRALLCALLAAGSAAAYYFIVQKRRRSIASAAAVAIFALLPCVELVRGGVTLLSGSMNVFYTLALGLACISLLDRARALAAGEKGGYPPWQLGVLGLLLAVSLLVIQPRADYAFGGTALIVCLYLCDGRRGAQAAVICLWGVLFYWIIYGSYVYALSCCVAAAPLMLYRGERGGSFKLGFYIIYPAHLLILGLTNVFALS